MEYKVAILHDYLNQYGGAERVLGALIEMFPEADLYALFYDEKAMKGVFKKNIQLIFWRLSDFLKELALLERKRGQKF